MDQSTFAPRARQAGANGFVSKTRELPGERAPRRIRVGGLFGHAGHEAAQDALKNWTRRAGSAACPTRNCGIMQMLAERHVQQADRRGAVHLLQDRQHAQDVRIMEKLGAGRSLVDVIDLPVATISPLADGDPPCMTR
ncbi:hypothetical protein ACTMU2_20325 [Cupriavidus basilensis]